MKPTVLTSTRVYRDQECPVVPAGRYVWRGKGEAVFRFENCRDAVIQGVDVVCESPVESVVICERTRSDPGTIPSTMNGFTRWRIQGNGLAERGFWYRSTVDENNEHGHWDSCSVYGCLAGWRFEGQQSKEHLLVHCRAETGNVGVKSDSGYQWVGGAMSGFTIAHALNKVGEPVTIMGGGTEACQRLLVAGDRGGVSTASQPVTLINHRFEADALATDGEMIVLRHAGPLIIQGGRYGGGDQPIPRIGLYGASAQSVELLGVLFGSYGAWKVKPVRVASGASAHVAHSSCRMQYHEGAAVNTMTVRPDAVLWAYD